MEANNKIIKTDPFKSFVSNKKGLKMAYVNSNLILTKKESEDYNKTKEKRLNKNILTSAIIAASLGMVALGAGIPRLRNSINTGLKTLEQKSRDLRQKENKLLKDKFLDASISWLIKVFQKLKIAGNFVPVRDVYVGKALNSNFLGRKFYNWTTNKFTEKTINVTKEKHKNVMRAFEMFRSKNMDIITYLHENPAMDKMIKHPKTGKNIKNSEYLEQELKNLENEIRKFISDFDKNRLGIIKDVTKNSQREAHKKIKDGNFGKSITDEILKNDKEALSVVLHDLKSKITSDTTNRVKEINRELKEINSGLNKKSKGARTIILEIKNLLNCYEYPREYPGVKKQLNSFDKESIRIKVQEDISKKIDNLIIEAKKHKENSKDTINTIKKLKEINNRMQEKGIIEDLSKYSKVFNPEEAYKYKEFKENRENLKKQLRKAVNNEENKLFDKLRDLNIGSAPTDILGQILPVAAVTYNITTSKNKKEKITSTLKGGIPVVGGITTILLATLKQINSFGSVLLGIAVGGVLNKVGGVIIKKVYPPTKEVQDKAKT